MIGIGDDRPVTIDSLDVAGHERTTPARQPLVELLVLGDGRTLNNTRFTSTGVGDRLRYVSHRTVVDDRTTRLIIEQRDDTTGLDDHAPRSPRTPTCAALQAHTMVRNTSDDEQIVQMISSLALGCVLDDGEAARRPGAALGAEQLVRGESLEHRTAAGRRGTRPDRPR